MYKTNNRSKDKVSARIASGTIIFSIVLLAFVVMPNFAQDYNNLDSNEDAAVVSEDASISGYEQAAEEANIEYGDVSYDQSLIDDWDENKASRLGEKLAALVRKLPDYPQDLARVFGKSTNPEIGWTGFKVFITILASLLLAIVIEQFTTRKLLNKLYNYIDQQEKSTALKFKFIFIRALIQLIGVVVLGIIAFGAAIYFRHDNPFYELMFSQIIGALLMMKLWMILLRNIFSPSKPTLRPIPLDDSTAKHLHRWFIVFFGIIEFGGALFAYLMNAGLSEAQLNGLLIPYTLSLNLIILSRVWAMREKITAMFLAEDHYEKQNPSQQFLHTAWPFVFTAWLLLLWMLWLYNSFLGQHTEAGYISISWWITLAFFVADRIFFGLVRNVVNIEWLHSPTFEKRSSRFIKMVMNGARVIMIAFAVYMMSLGIGFQTDSLMQDSMISRLFGQAIDLLVIATITYVVWEFFNALIEKQLPEELDVIASLEGDGGGVGGTRAETLLPLMRIFLSIMLVTFVILSVLNSLGIAITPLLAGAGVVGIAIGFGAQKLVQDVLSGIFFLVDDAFRKNEYIEIENLRGTVEKISLRSMQLRHHLGAVQTIPYGEIKTVKNLSRDWITMKLELRLSYDTDIEKVRKIIKKVGQEMLEDEITGPSFILPLKSQGVMRVEESALIFRMKFTTKPGEQWVVRREAYRKVRDALSAAGIFFAHREVRVRLPDDEPKTLPTSEQKPAETPTEDATFAEDAKSDDKKDLLTKAGAAAAESIFAAEAKAKGKINFDDEM